MKNNSQRGFTLIELLVVIAIIGILASVVLASLNTARAKGSDANIIANLSNARGQAEIYYDVGARNAYKAPTGSENVCNVGVDKQGIKDLIEAAGKTAGATYASSGTASATTYTCYVNSIGTQWAAVVPLKNKRAGAQDYFCVDSSGSSRNISTPTTNTTCY